MSNQTTCTQCDGSYVLIEVIRPSLKLYNTLVELRACPECSAGVGYRLKSYPGGRA